MKANDRGVVKYSLLTIFSLLFFIAVSYLAAFGFAYKIISGSILYFVVCSLGPKFFPVFKPSVFFQLLILPIVVVIVVYNVFQFKDTLVSFPSNIFLLIGASFGYWFYKSPNFWLPLLLISFVFTWQYAGTTLFLNYINFGTLSGKVSERIPLMNLYYSNGTTATPKLSKTVILDFWNSKCGYCYALFPLIDSVHKKIDTSRFDLRVVNIPFKTEKKEDNYNLLDRFHYSFNQVFMDNASSMDSFNITGFPTTIVLQDNRIIYRGDFEEALKMLDIK